jgi:hypothetical protein
VDFAGSNSTSIVKNMMDFVDGWVDFVGNSKDLI